MSQSLLLCAYAFFSFWVGHQLGAYKKSAHDYRGTFTLKKKKKRKCEYITSRRRSASRALLGMDVSLASVAGEKPFLLPGMMRFFGGEALMRSKLVAVE